MSLFLVHYTPRYIFISEDFIFILILKWPSFLFQYKCVELARTRPTCAETVYVFHLVRHTVNKSNIITVCIWHIHKLYFKLFILFQGLQKLLINNFVSRRQINRRFRFLIFFFKTDVFYSVAYIGNKYIRELKSENIPTVY